MDLLDVGTSTLDLEKQGQTKRGGRAVQDRAGPLGSEDLGSWQWWRITRRTFGGRGRLAPVLTGFYVSHED